MMNRRIDQSMDERSAAGWPGGKGRIVLGIVGSVVGAAVGALVRPRVRRDRGGIAERAADPAPRRRKTVARRLATTITTGAAVVSLVRRLGAGRGGMRELTREGREELRELGKQITRRIRRRGPEPAAPGLVNPEPSRPAPVSPRPVSPAAIDPAAVGPAVGYEDVYPRTTRREPEAPPPTPAGREGSGRGRSGAPGVSRARH